MPARSTLLAATAALVLLIVGCGDDETQAPEPAGAAVAELRRTDPDASRLLDGGVGEFRRRLAAADDRPVVVNQWASWCGPGRVEFPFFQGQAVKRRGEVRFLGVNSRDSTDEALKFLARSPTSFAHVADPDANVAGEFRGGRSWPTTAFYDGRGLLNYTKQGSYRDERALAADIDRYATP